MTYGIASGATNRLGSRERNQPNSFIETANEIEKQISDGIKGLGTKSEQLREFKNITVGGEASNPVFPTYNDLQNLSYTKSIDKNKYSSFIDQIPIGREANRNQNANDSFGQAGPEADISTKDLGLYSGDVSESARFLRSTQIVWSPKSDRNNPTVKSNLQTIGSILVNNYHEKTGGLEPKSQREGVPEISSTVFGGVRVPNEHLQYLSVNGEAYIAGKIGDMPERRLITEHGKNSGQVTNNFSIAEMMDRRIWEEDQYSLSNNEGQSSTNASSSEINAGGSGGGLSAGLTGGISHSKTEDQTIGSAYSKTIKDTNSLGFNSTSGSQSSPKPGFVQNNPNGFWATSTTYQSKYMLLEPVNGSGKYTGYMVDYDDEKSEKKFAIDYHPKGGNLKASESIFPNSNEENITWDIDSYNSDNIAKANNAIKKYYENPSNLNRLNAALSDPDLKRSAPQSQSLKGFDDFTSMLSGITPRKDNKEEWKAIRDTVAKASLEPNQKIALEQILNTFSHTKPRKDNKKEWKNISSISETISRGLQTGQIDLKQGFEKTLEMLSSIKPKKDNKEEWTTIRNTTGLILHTL